MDAAWVTWIIIGALALICFQYIGRNKAPSPAKNNTNNAAEGNNTTIISPALAIKEEQISNQTLNKEALNPAPAPTSTSQDEFMPSLRSGLISLGNLILFLMIIVVPIMVFLVGSLLTNIGIGLIAALVSIAVALPAGIVCALFLDMREQLVKLNQRP